jgi:hypothetical protein
MRIAVALTTLAMGAAVVASAANAADAKKYTDLPKGSRPAAATPATARPPRAQQGSLTFYTSRAVFDAAHPGIPLEDFGNTNVPPNSVMACDGPFNSQTNNGCFSPGDILPGISIVNTSGGQLVVLTPPFFGVNCVAVGPNTFVENGELDFNPPVEAVGLDLNSNVPDTYNIEVFGPGGSLGTTTAPGNIPGIFWGVDTSDPGGISRITTNSPAGSGELYCNVAFGNPVPVELQGFTVE